MHTHFFVIVTEHGVFPKNPAYFIINNNTDTLPPICTLAPEAAHPFIHYRTKAGVFTARH